MRFDRSSAAEEISPVPDWMAEVLADTTFKVSCSFSIAPLKSPRSFSYSGREARVEAVDKVAVGEPLHAGSDRIDHEGLLFRGRGPDPFAGLPIHLRLAADVFDLLLLRQSPGGVVLEHLNGFRHPADFIGTGLTRNLDGEVAAREIAHRRAELHQRPRDLADRQPYRENEPEQHHAAADAEQDQAGPSGAVP